MGGSFFLVSQISLQTRKEYYILSYLIGTVGSSQNTVRRDHYDWGLFYPPRNLEREGATGNTFLLPFQDLTSSTDKRVLFCFCSLCMLARRGKEMPG